MDRKAYSTDLTDPQWTLIDPFLRAWKAKRPSPSGHEGRYDNQIGVRLLDQVVAHTPTVTKAWVDAGFKDDVAIHGAIHGIDVEQVLRSDSAAGFVPITCSPRTNPACSRSPRPGPGPPMPPSRNDIRNDNGARTATCPTCRQSFTPIRRQRYCTPACRQAA